MIGTAVELQADDIMVPSLSPYIVGHPDPTSSAPGLQDGRIAARLGKEAPFFIPYSSSWYPYSAFFVPKDVTGPFQFQGVISDLFPLELLALRIGGIGAKVVRFTESMGEHWAWLSYYCTGFWEEQQKLGYPPRNEDGMIDVGHSRLFTSVIAGTCLAIGVIGTAVYHKLSKKGAIFKVTGM
ncbi:MAG: hypothetical protein LBJ77_00400 [Holosporales bacterium]|nr:hypothetical protein [Holosporales bacterium]